MINIDMNDASIGAGYEDRARKSDGYWQREQSVIGRMVNSVIDRCDNALVVAGAALTFSRDQISDALQSNRELDAMKTEWRAAGPTLGGLEADGPLSTERLYPDGRNIANDDRALEQQELFPNSPTEQRWLAQQAELQLENDELFYQSELEELNLAEMHSRDQDEMYELAEIENLQFDGNRHSDREEDLDRDVG